MYYLILLVYYALGIIFFLISDLTIKKQDNIANNELLDELI